VVWESRPPRATPIPATIGAPPGGEQAPGPRWSLDAVSRFQP
jgi:hypothetical protein